MNVTQGAIMAKAGLAAQGLIDSPAVRLPLVAADEVQTARARGDRRGPGAPGGRVTAP